MCVCVRTRAPVGEKAGCSFSPPVVLTCELIKGGREGGRGE